MHVCVCVCVCVCAYFNIFTVHYDGQLIQPQTYHSLDIIVICYTCQTTLSDYRTHTAVPCHLVSNYIVSSSIDSVMSWLCVCKLQQYSNHVIPLCNQIWHSVNSTFLFGQHILIWPTQREELKTRLANS